MPLYEYECSKCRHRVEKIESFSGPHLRKCPKCGGKVEQLTSAPAIQFKGSGWYVTDYGRKTSGGDSAKDAATAEISRAQVWQWIKTGSPMENGQIVTSELCRTISVEAVAKARALRPVAQPDRYEDAAALFLQLIEAPQCPEFLTLPAYAMLER